MKVLVTGGSGFIGSHIVDRLVEVGYSLRALDAGKITIYSSGNKRGILSLQKMLLK